MPVSACSWRQRAGILPLAAATSALSLLAAPLVAQPAPAAAHLLSHPAVVTTAPPPILREFRGVWVATVGNIDWPSRPGLSSAEQQRELLAILDRAAALRLNAVIFQVRPAGDALYHSELEPWSEFLTGAMGRAPEPFYDPLAFAVAEAHKRGLELHAWFNPYRARFSKRLSPAAPSHLSRTRPELVRDYGPYQWLDPGEPDARAHAVRVIMDVVRRYDVDGVHIDDYFYPYRERDRRGRAIPFPDDRSWARYEAAGGTLTRDDWRRANVDSLVHRLYRAIRLAKPWVKFGVSPFGIWRPGYPSGIEGLDAYQELYADSRKWLAEGWVDYLAPQLYWPHSRTAQSYPVLLRWWAEQNRHGRHLWPGTYTSRTWDEGSSRWPAREILDQIRLTREDPGASGNIHFSMRTLMHDSAGLAGLLTGHTYGRPALVPASPWLGRGLPGRPTLDAQGPPGRDVTVALQPAPGERAWLWVVSYTVRGAWRTDVVPGARAAFTLPASAGMTPGDFVAVSVVDRYGTESPFSVLFPRRAPAPRRIGGPVIARD